MILPGRLDGVANLRRYSRVEVDRGRPHAESITVTPRVALLAARDGAPGVQLVDATGAVFERAERTPGGALAATFAPGATRPQEAAVTVLDALPPERRAGLQGITVAADGTVDLRFGTVVARWGRPGGDRLTAAVSDALLDTAGIARLDVSAPRRPFTTAAN